MPKNTLKCFPDRDEGCEVGVAGGQARLPHRGARARGKNIF